MSLTCPTLRSISLLLIAHTYAFACALTPASSIKRTLETTSNIQSVLEHENQHVDAHWHIGVTH